MTGLPGKPPTGAALDVAREFAPSPEDHRSAFLSLATRGLQELWTPGHEKVERVPVSRVWSPDRPDLEAVPATFRSRHPDLWFAFANVTARKEPTTRQPSKSFWKGRVQSGLHQRGVRTTGDLEFRGLKTLELDPTVTACMEQPIVVVYQMDGRRRTYTPDLYVERGGDAGFVEFKHEEHAAADGEESLFKAKGEALAAAGYRFEVVTEHHLDREPLASNVETVHRAIHQWVNAAETQTIRDHLGLDGEASIAEVRAAAGISLGQVLFLIRNCVLGADLRSLPITERTPVRLRTRGHAVRPDGRQLSTGIL